MITLILYYTLAKLIFSARTYIFFCPPFSFSQKENSSNATTREEEEFSDSQIFHFYESSKSSQRILLAFRFLLLFFVCTSFTKYQEFQLFVVHQALAQSVQ